MAELAHDGRAGCCLDGGQHHQHPLDTDFDAAMDDFKARGVCSQSFDYLNFNLFKESGWSSEMGINN